MSGANALRVFCRHRHRSGGCIQLFTGETRTGQEESCMSSSTRLEQATARTQQAIIGRTGTRAANAEATARGPACSVVLKE